MLIDTFIEKWRKIFQEETNALFTAIQEMVYNKFSILKEKPVISKYHEELKKNYRSLHLPGTDRQGGDGGLPEKRTGRDVYPV